MNWWIRWIYYAFIWPDDKLWETAQFWREFGGRKRYAELCLKEIQQELKNGD